MQKSFVRFVNKPIYFNANFNPFPCINILNSF